MSVVPNPASAFSSRIFHVSPAVTGIDLFVLVDGPWFVSVALPVPLD